MMKIEHTKTTEVFTEYPGDSYFQAVSKAIDDLATGSINGILAPDTNIFKSFLTLSGLSAHPDLIPADKQADFVKIITTPKIRSKIDDSNKIAAFLTVASGLLSLVAPQIDLKQFSSLVDTAFIVSSNQDFANDEALRKRLTEIFEHSAQENKTICPAELLPAIMTAISNPRDVCLGKESVVAKQRLAREFVAEVCIEFMNEQFPAIPNGSAWQPFDQQSGNCATFRIYPDPITG